jgi:hypothetical protein
MKEEVQEELVEDPPERNRNLVIYLEQFVKLMWTGE